MGHDDLHGYVTVGMAARTLVVSPARVQQWYDAGVLTGLRTPSGDRLILRDSVHALARQRKAQGR